MRQGVLVVDPNDKRYKAYSNVRARRIFKQMGHDFFVSKALNSRMLSLPIFVKHEEQPQALSNASIPLGITPNGLTPKGPGAELLSLKDIING